MNLVNIHRDQRLIKLVMAGNGDATEKTIEFGGRGILLVTVGTEREPATDRELYELRQTFEQAMAIHDPEEPLVIAASHRLDIRFISTR